MKERKREIEEGKITGFFDKETGLQTAHSMVTVQWQGGKKVIVWPPAAAVQKLYYPMPTFDERAKGNRAVPE